MCGIWISIGSDDASDNRAVSAIAARGPDGRGVKTFQTPAGRLCLGHTRLSIYDTSQNGAQPMATSDNRFHIVFNGAIYNFLELRERLRAAGVTFNSDTDTEVLLKGWALWGEAILPKLRGMFAFAVFDNLSKELVLVRDRFGEKPLHLYAGQNMSSPDFMAGSDPQQFFKAVQSLKPRLNKNLVSDFIDFGAINAPDQTFFENIKTLPGGHLMKLDLSQTVKFDASRQPDQKQWWSLPNPSLYKGTEEAAAGDLHGYLKQAVKLQLAADVPVGSCLSGGMDSSSIVRVSDKLLSNSTASLNCIGIMYQGRDGRGHDISENRYFEAAIAAKNLRGHIISPSDNDVLENFDEIIKAQREPFPHSSICAQWFVYSKAKELGIKVMLDGQGADELLAGYPFMIGAHQADLLRQLKFRAWYGTVTEFGSEGGFFRKSELLKTSYNAVIPESVRRIFAKLRGRWPPETLMASQPSLPVANTFDSESRLRKLREDLLVGGSLPNLLRYEDRNAMAHGIESRLPFLDTELVAHVQSLPSSYLIGEGYMKNTLRNAMKNTVPDSILNRRRKVGFITPQEKWMKGTLGQAARESLPSLAARWPNMFDINKINNLFETNPTDPRLFRLFVLERWAETFGVV